MSTGIVIALGLLVWLPAGLVVCALFAKNEPESLEDLIERRAMDAQAERDGGTCRPAA